MRNLLTEFNYQKRSTKQTKPQYMWSVLPSKQPTIHQCCTQAQCVYSYNLAKSQNNFRYRLAQPQYLGLANKSKCMLQGTHLASQSKSKSLYTPVVFKQQNKVKRNIWPRVRSPFHLLFQSMEKYCVSQQPCSIQIKINDCIARTIFLLIWEGKPIVNLPTMGIQQNCWSLLALRLPDVGSFPKIEWL